MASGTSCGRLCSHGSVGASEALVTRGARIDVVNAERWIVSACGTHLWADVAGTVVALRAVRALARHGETGILIVLAWRTWRGSRVVRTRGAVVVCGTRCFGIVTAISAVLAGRACDASTDGGL